MTRRENILRAIRFERPDCIPMHFGINGACWHHYDQDALQDLMESHPLLFPGFRRERKVLPCYGLNARKDTPYTDPWGCVWFATDDGITGSVHGHPLADWAGFEQYTPPDPNVTDGTFPFNWRETRAGVQTQKQNGDLVFAVLPHNHTFLRLQDIRGYENLMFDMQDGEPRLSGLIEMVENFNYEYVMKWMELEPDMMAFGEDLGMQVGPMLSPEHFRRYIQPVYRRLIKPARDRGCIVHGHSDGDIRTLVEDLIGEGVEVFNLQDRVNGIEWIAKNLAGRVCVELDIDRQHVTRTGTPRQIDDLIQEEVKKIGSKQGGMMMGYGLYPGIPLANAKAVMDAMERYADYYV